jgi:methionyl-tRNA formyltransferase
MYTPGLVGRAARRRRSASGSIWHGTSAATVDITPRIIRRRGVRPGVRLAFLGTPAFAVPSLRRLVEAGHDVGLVVTQPDRPAGRGRAPTAPPVKVEAARLGRPLFQPERLSAPEGIERLVASGAELGVVAAYGEVLSRDLLAALPRGFVNVHPSLLPRLRGATPIPTAILLGLEQSGVTVMRVSPGVDAGPILAQVGEPIRDDDTGETLARRLAELGGELLVETLPRWLDGRIAARPQDGRCATYSEQLRREDGRADWSRPAVELWRRCRAFQPWPGLYTTWEGRLLKLLEVAPLPSRQGHQPGQVFAHRDGLAVACGTGALLLRRLQAEGRGPMTAEELARGQRGFPSGRLGT